MRLTTSRSLPHPGARRGSAAVEFAVVVLFIVPLLVGIWEVSRLVEVQQVLANAAREGGRQAAAGRKNVAGVQQDVLNYLVNANIQVRKNGAWAKPTLSDITVTVTNLTSASRPDPSGANQLDHFQVQVAVPFDSVRWILLNQITSVTTLSASSDWYSMKDIPLTVNQTIPLQ